MGSTAHIREMAVTGLYFLTALTVTEFDSYAQSIPHEAFAGLKPTDEASRTHDVEQAAQCAQAAGMEKAEDDLFVLDLGVVERDDDVDPSPAHHAADDATISAMQQCRQIEESVAQGCFSSYAAAGRAVGLRKGVVSKYRLLGRLSEQQQRDVLEGKAVGCSLADLIRIAAIEQGDERQNAFDALVAASSGQPRRAHAIHEHPAPHPAASQDSIRVRVVAYFNPERFVDQRRRAQEKLDQINAFVAELNAKMNAPRSRHTARAVAAAVDRRLRQDALLEAFHVDITEHSIAGRTRLHVDVVLDQAEWDRRRRYDGFTVLVALATGAVLALVPVLEARRREELRKKLVSELRQRVSVQRFGPDTVLAAVR
jgi:hypothetical protein